MTTIVNSIVSIALASLGFILIVSPARGQTVAASTIDVQHYEIKIEPDIANKTLKGNTVIRFVSNRLKVVEFDCGDLVIDSVRERSAPLQFSVDQHRVKINLPTRLAKSREVAIDYHGAPKRGIRFFPDREQVYTIYATSQWTVCIDAPGDKASLTLHLILPDKLTPVANGRMISRTDLPGNRRATVWEQNVPIPTYIFGFAVGPFELVSVQGEGVELRYLATGFSDDEVRKIFRDTPDMLKFFEMRSGVRYPDLTYTQVLAAGGVEQEMSSFTALKESYGKQLLASEQDLWLGAHEFAHQWWGNMVTCHDWNHFWLNEGIATFMAAAYIENRFGRAAYMKEIESYREGYEKVRVAGKDKSLVFPDWNHPTSEDRSLVYDKGAYVIHLLREEMGERAFWKGLRVYTRRYFGKSVVTANFTDAMQEASAKSLKHFFAKWIYLTEV